MAQKVARLAERSPKAIQRHVGIRKNPKVLWDVMIDLDYPRLLRVPLIHRHWGTPTYLLVKRFDTTNPVSLEELQQLGEGLYQDLRWQRGLDIYRIFLVAANEFDDDAVEAVRAESISCLSDYPVELVTETAQGYTLPIKD